MASKTRALELQVGGLIAVSAALLAGFALLPGSVVRGVDPPRTDLIVARLYEFLDAITSVLRDDKDAIRDVLKNGSSMVKTLDAILVENREQIGRLLKNVDKLTVEASGLL